MRYRIITFAILGIILVGIGEWNLRSRKLDPLKSLNNFWLEFCVANSGDAVREPAVTLVRINDDYDPLTIGGDAGAAAADGSVPSLSRLDFATILGFTGKLNPKAVSFVPTPSFDDSNPLNQTDIVPLKDAALQVPKMTLGTVVSSDAAPENKLQGVAYPALKVEGDASSITPFTRTIQSPDPQLLANGEPAFTEVDSARALRSEESIRIPLVAKQGEKVVPSLVLMSVARLAGIGLEAITVDLSKKQAQIQIGDQYTVPIAKDGSMNLPAYAGLKAAMTSEEINEKGEKVERFHFATLTVDELAYTGQQDDEVAKRILSEFQGKFDSVSRNLVMIGYDRKADRRFPTAAGEMLSDASIFARAVATIQSGRYIERWPTWGRWVAVLAIVIIALVVFRLSRGKVLVVGGISALLFFALCVLLFRSTLTWTPPFVMFALFALIIVVGLIIPAGNSGAAKEESLDSDEADSLKS